MDLITLMYISKGACIYALRSPNFQRFSTTMRWLLKLLPGTKVRMRKEQEEEGWSARFETETAADAAYGR